MDTPLIYKTERMICLKAIVAEDFVNYKTPSLFMGFPHCNFKCDLEAGRVVCQNHSLAQEKNLYFNLDTIISNYINNPIPRAIVFGGLEPFFSLRDMLVTAQGFRKNEVQDPIVIYSGYMPDEILSDPEMNKTFLELVELKNIIIKYGRYIPDRPSIYNEILGVTLASDNQFAIAY